MKKTNKEILAEIIKDEIFLFEYTVIDNLSKKDYNPKLTVKIGKRIDKNLSKLLQTDEGIKELKTLLDMKDIRLNFVAARYLYPIMPKTSLLIIQRYKNNLKDELGVHEVDNLIKGFQSKQKIFMDQFKKLYNVDDLDSLNMEK